MAKKTKIVAKYILSPSAKGDVWADKKYKLNSELSQKDLEYLYNQGLTDIVIKIEG